MNNNIDWEDILETIKDEKCVLFIDSRFYSGQDSNIVDLINQKVFNNPKLGYVKSHYPDGFIFLNREDFRNRLIRKMKSTYDNFYEEVYPLLDKISQIPFHLIISLSPDNLLSRVMSENGFPHNNAAYSKETSSQYFEATSKMPLIYNMLGSFNDFGSVVLTHDDLFSFLERNFTGKSISLEMKKQIFDADRYLFLGFPFERWYIQLLMRMI